MIHFTTYTTAKATNALAVVFNASLRKSFTPLQQAFAQHTDPFASMQQRNAPPQEAFALPTKSNAHQQQENVKLPQQIATKTQQKNYQQYIKYEAGRHIGKAHRSSRTKANLAKEP